MNRFVRLLAVAAVTLLGLASAASAHVTVNPGEAKKGAFAVLAFRVPNERDDAGTTKVEINFPADHPIPFVSVRPHPGWTYTVERTRLDKPVEAHGRSINEVVSKITFTGGPIRPGEFDEFEVSAGPLPEDADQLVFPTLQTYESGEVVRWIEPTPAGGEEPEHPAPVLRLVAGAGDGHGDDGAMTATTTGAGEARGVNVSAAAAKDDADGARPLAIIALIVGALGLVAGGVGILRTRST
jgi:uncharacterized protein YcnI